MVPRVILVPIGIGVFLFARYLPPLLAIRRHELYVISFRVGPPQEVKPGGTAGETRPSIYGTGFFIFKYQIERRDNMLGISDPMILTVYVLCIGSALSCVIYGVRNWNKES